MTELTVPVRILAAADIHGAISVYEWLVQGAIKHRADLLILAGDLFAADWEDEQRKQAGQIISVLGSGACPCFYIMGNDDNVSLDYEDKRIRPLHGRRLSFGSLNFVGYEYTPPFVGTTFVKPETEIENDLKSLEALLDSESVFVTHAPAYGNLDLSYSGEHVGSRSLATLLGRKLVLGHIHGHVHDSFGRDGSHFNVAAAGLRRAILIDLPALKHQVLVAE
jgi:Icc-related predicted phosphoesterase